MKANTDVGPGRTDHGARGEALTAQEHVVLAYLATGMTDRQIAAALVVTVPTVKSHEQHLYGKLGVRNRTEAARRAWEMGLHLNGRPAE